MDITTVKIFCIILVSSTR